MAKVEGGSFRITLNGLSTEEMFNREREKQELREIDFYGLKINRIENQLISNDYSHEAFLHYYSLAKTVKGIGDDRAMRLASVAENYKYDDWERVFKNLGYYSESANNLNWRKLRHWPKKVSINARAVLLANPFLSFDDWTETNKIKCIDKIMEYRARDKSNVPFGNHVFNKDYEGKIKPGETVNIQGLTSITVDTKASFDIQIDKLKKRELEASIRLQSEIMKRLAGF